MNDSGPSSFKPIPNPYIVGNPIRDPRMFFGREDDFTYVKRKFSGDKGGGVIVLCGARRSGKTSILFQISDGRLGEDFLPVLTDMQSMTINNDQDFLCKLAQEVVTTVDHPDITMDGVEPRWTDNPFTAFENLIKKINAAAGDKRLILMFDEYELFETHIDSGIISTHILNLLANLIEHRRVFVVFTGSDKLEARNRPFWGIFLSKALHRRISFLSHGDTLRLVEQPVGDTVSYGKDIPETVFKLTAGQPFYTQVVCQSMIDHLNENHRSNVEAEDLRQVVDEIIENPLPQMIFSWNALGDLEKLSLSIMAELSKEQVRPAAPKDILHYAEQENIGYRLDVNELNKCLENLFHHDVLTKDGGAELYRFKMELWRLWVTRMHSVWQVIDQMERSKDGPLAKGILAGEAGGRSKRGVIAATVITVAAAISIGAWLMSRNPDLPPPEPIELARLNVETNPAGANVFVDDTWVGISPVDAAEVPAASRSLRIELPGYHTVNDTLILAKDETKALDFHLREIGGGLRILSDPPGAAVHIDGENTNLVTPVVIPRLSANTPHRVELNLAGYQPVVLGGIRVYEESTITVGHTFVKMSGALSIVSQPPEAQVHLDGEFVGTTPCIIQKVPYGRHRLDITKAGYSGFSKQVDVAKANERIEADLGLLPPGKVVFSIQPYAALSIDGNLIREDVTYHEVELAPGIHTIVLEHPQLGTYSEEVEVRSNESTTVQHKFSD
jgi:hypothetical protein